MKHAKRCSGPCTVCGGEPAIVPLPAQQIVSAQAIATAPAFMPAQAVFAVRPPYKTQRQFVPLTLNAPVVAPFGGTDPPLYTAAPVEVPFEAAAAELPVISPGTSPFSAAAPQPTVMISQPLVLYPKPNFAHVLLGDPQQYQGER